jgi:hypothetical protein
MIRVSSTTPSFIGRLIQTLILASLALVMVSSPATAQDLTADSAAAVKTAFMADIETMREKFIGLAEAFPQDKYDYRPMEGTRSVAEVLMLIASEGYGFAPTSFGGEAAMSRDESRELSSVTDKAQVIDHLTKGFAHAKGQLEAIDPATLVAARNLFGSVRSTPAIALFVSGDMHEHLGQLIAYARANEIVPPWSR